MLRSCVSILLLACLPALAGAQAPNPVPGGGEPTPAPAAPSTPVPNPVLAPPVDWTAALGAVANIDVLSSAGAVVRRTHGISLGEPPVLLTRYSDLAGGAKILATFRGGTKVTASTLTAADPVNNLAAVKADGPLPAPPQPAGYIKWWYAKVFAIPGPAQGDTAIAATVNEPLKLGSLRVIPLGGDHPSGLPVMDVQGKWIGISGKIEDATGSFVYVTGSEDVIPVLFGPQKEVPLSSIPASFRWCPPNEAQGMLVRAVLRAHEKPAEAGPFFELALKRDPKLAEIPYWMGVVAFRQQSFTDAESSFVRAGRLRSDWSLPWHMAGAAANQQGHYELALKHYDRALQVDPNSAMTLGNQAGALYNLHRIEDSVKSLTKAIASDSTYAPAYQMLGAIYIQQGKRFDAERLYEKLLTMDPRTAQSLRDLLDGKK